jgi:hypothetical protein
VPLVKALNHQADCTLRQEQQMHLVLAASPLRNFSRLFAPRQHPELEPQITQLFIQISGRHKVPARRQLAMRRLDCTRIYEQHLLPELARLLLKNETQCCDSLLQQELVQQHQNNFIPTYGTVWRLVRVEVLPHLDTENLGLQPERVEQLPATPLSDCIPRQEQQPEMELAQKVHHRSRLFQERQALLVRVHNLQMVYMLHQEPLLLQLLVQVQQVNLKFCLEPLSHLEYLVKLRLENTLLREEQQLQAEQPRATKHLDYTSLHVQQMEVVKARNSQLSCGQYIEMRKQQVCVAQVIRPSTAISVLQQLRVEQRLETMLSDFTLHQEQPAQVQSLVRLRSDCILRQEQFRHSAEQRLETMLLAYMSLRAQHLETESLDRQQHLIQTQ